MLACGARLRPLGVSYPVTLLVGGEFGVQALPEDKVDEAEDIELLVDLLQPLGLLQPERVQGRLIAEPLRDQAVGGVVAVVDELSLLGLCELSVLEPVARQHTKSHGYRGDDTLDLPQICEDPLGAALVEVTQAVGALEEEKRAVVLEEVLQEVARLTNEQLDLAVALGLESYQLGLDGPLRLQRLEIHLGLTLLSRGFRVLCLLLEAACALLALHEALQELLVVHP